MVTFGQKKWALARIFWVCVACCKRKVGKWPKKVGKWPKMKIKVGTNFTEKVPKKG